MRQLNAKEYGNGSFSAHHEVLSEENLEIPLREDRMLLETLIGESEKDEMAIENSVKSYLSQHPEALPIAVHLLVDNGYDRVASRCFDRITRSNRERISAESKIIALGILQHMGMVEIHLPLLFDKDSDNQRALSLATKLSAEYELLDVCDLVVEHLCERNLIALESKAQLEAFEKLSAGSLRKIANHLVKKYRRSPEEYSNSPKKLYLLAKLMESTEMLKDLRKIWTQLLRNSAAPEYEARYFDSINHHYARNHIGVVQELLQSLGDCAKTRKNKNRIKNGRIQGDLNDLCLGLQQESDPVSGWISALQINNTDTTVGRAISFADTLVRKGRFVHAARLWHALLLERPDKLKAFRRFIGPRFQQLVESDKGLQRQLINTHLQSLVSEGAISEAAHFLKALCESQPDDIRTISKYLNFIREHEGEESYFIALEEILVTNKEKKVLDYVMNLTIQGGGLNTQDALQLWKLLFRYGGEGVAGPFSNFLCREIVQNGTAFLFEKSLVSEFLEESPEAKNAFIAVAMRLKNGDIQRKMYQDPSASYNLFQLINKTRSSTQKQKFQKAAQFLESGAVEKAMAVWTPLQEEHLYECVRFASLLTFNRMIVEAEGLWREIGRIDPEYCVVYGSNFLKNHMHPSHTYSIIRQLLPGHNAEDLTSAQRDSLRIYAALAGRDSVVYFHSYDELVHDLLSTGAMQLRESRELERIRRVYQERSEDQEMRRYVSAKMPTLQRPSIFRLLTERQPRHIDFQNQQARKVFKRGKDTF